MKSWPVEVGWSFLEGEPTSMLICPEEHWLSDGWDKAAESLHGYSIDHLKRFGTPAKRVCDQLNDTFKDCAVYSDAPSWDSFWLYRLFSSAKTKASFELQNFATLINPLIRGREDAVIKEASKLAPRSHRSADDAKNLQTVYRLAIEGCLSP